MNIYRLIATTSVAALLAACGQAEAPENPAPQEVAAETPAPVVEPEEEELGHAQKISEVAPGIHMITDKGGNIGVLSGPDGVFVIDSQFGDNAAENLAEINAIAGEQPRFLLNTHYHGDHTGGNEIFAHKGATIIAHDHVRERLMTTTKRADRTIEPAPPGAWPIITFDAGMSLHLNGQTIRAMHVANAHTDGDTIVLLEEANTVHMGDVMFAGRWPFIDLDSGGSVDGYLAALAVVHAMIDDETKVIPGHGPLSTRADVQALSDKISEARDLIMPMVSSGISIEEIVALAPLTQISGDWGSGFINDDRMAATLAKDMGAKRADD